MKQLSRKWLSEGYVIIYHPEHINARPDGSIPEHRYVMSQHLNRPLDKGEVVHHKNGNRTDNRVDNLELMNEIEHNSIPNSGQFKKGVVPHNKSDNFVKCLSCGKQFHSPPSHKHRKTCSHKCKWNYLSKLRP